MKIYRNKLYCILDAAKRSSLNCDQIIEMITYHVIMAPKQFGVAYILGEDIPGLEAKWKEWEGKKDKMKKVDISILRMDRGD